MKRSGIIFLFLISACGRSLSTPVVPVVTPAELIVTETPVPSSDGLTQIHIDGDPLDWGSYPIMADDPAGDGSGNVDITSIHAFTNDKYLYVLVEVDGEIGSYAQLDLDINPRGDWPEYMANSYPNNGDGIPHVARIENGEFRHLENKSGDVAQGDAFELRIPLDLLAGTAIEQVRLRVMDGECCGSSWVAVDETSPVEVLKTNEIEASLAVLTDLTASNSAFCTGSSLEPPGSFKPATDIDVPEGFHAEYFIPPSGVNVPSDLVVMPNGDILVASSRARSIHSIGEDGSISSYAQLHAYSLDTDSSGNVYGYNFPSGEVFDIAENSEGAVIAQMPDTACESTMAVAPDGMIYIGFNQCSGQSMGESGIYKIPAGGGVPAMLTAIQEEGVQALDVDSSGRLFAMIGQSLETIDTQNGERHNAAQLPEWPSFHGLAVAENGTAFVSTGDFEDTGSLYRIAPSGNVEKLASIAGNGLEGLALWKGEEIVGVQRAIGGVQVIRQDGSVRALVEPNGLVSPQSLAFSPCGELLTVNDESGRLTLAYPDGRNIPFTPIISFQPPQTFLAFAVEGWYATGESAPGFPSIVNRYLPNGSHETLASDIEWVSGVALAEDGSIYVSATNDGRIFRISPDGERELIAEGLSFPQALALNKDGLLYAVTGGQGFGDVFFIPTMGDGIVSITSEGIVTELASIPDATQIAIGADGYLYIAAGNSIVRMTGAGETEPFAGGFNLARGAAFDIAGNLYVADDNGNDIVRISGFPVGSIRGRVLDESGNPVAGALVRVTQAVPPFAGGLTASASDGTFTLPVAPMEYTVTVWAEGYRTTTITVLDLSQEAVVELLPE
ncbi:MAG: carboxypeptidase regulatory-like domain-containing protein [Chloroflexi bacterium]|nr:carboxypeptidase regulatory-like domain-containing protein [Chloroflexota bacterium]